MLTKSISIVHRAYQHGAVHQWGDKWDVNKGRICHARSALEFMHMRCIYDSAPIQ